MKLIKKLGRKQKNHYKETIALFLCPYCNKKMVKNISSKKDKSCGCETINLRKQHLIKTGESNTRLYKIWLYMKNRCYNIKNSRYKNYGARGITVCDEWKNSFESFRDWAFRNGYKNNLTINRIENDLVYYPENCEWITKSKNSQKRTTTKLTELQVKEIRTKYKTGKYKQKELAEEYNVSSVHISNIINHKKWR